MTILKKIAFAICIGGLLSPLTSKAASTKIYGKGGVIAHPDGTNQICPEEGKKKCAKVNHFSPISPGDIVTVEFVDGTENLFQIAEINGMPDLEGNYQGSQIVFLPVE